MSEEIQEELIEEAEEQQEDNYEPENNDDQKEEEKPRIQFEQNSQIVLQLGQNGEVEINPGPVKSFQIKFRINDQNSSDELVINICDGQCKIQQQSKIQVKQNSTQQIVSQKQNASDLYSQLYKKIE